MCAALLTGFAACSDSNSQDEPTPPLPDDQLAQPKPEIVKADATSFMVKWDAVAHATSYVYTVNEEAEQTTTSMQIVRVDLTPDTEYTVKVKAIAEGYTDSKWASLTVKTEVQAEEPAFVIKVPESGIKAFSAHVTIEPKDKSETYYSGILPKSKYDTYASTQEIADELIEYLGELYPAYLSLFVQADDMDGEAMTLPQTEYVVYAFNWSLSGVVSPTAVTKSFTTPAGVKSASTIDIAFNDVDRKSVV